MMSGVIIPILSSILVLALCGCGLLPITQAANFTITNNCPETVWAAWYSSASGSGGRELNSGNKVWLLDVAAGTAGGRIWGRTGCNFDGSGSGPCATGGCADKLICTTTGAANATLAEFSLNQAADGGAVVDYYDISVVDGFNVAMGLGPTNPKCGSPKCGSGDCANASHPNNPKVYNYPSQGTNYAITFCPS